MLAFEQGLGVAGEFENLHALVHVGLLGLLVAVNVALAARLFLTPMPGHLVVKIAADLPVKLVDVHCLDAGLEAIVFRAEPPNRLLVLAPLVGVTGMKCFANPLQHLVVEAQPRLAAG